MVQAEFAEGQEAPKFFFFFETAYDKVFRKRCKLLYVPQTIFREEEMKLYLVRGPRWLLTYNIRVRTRSSRLISTKKQGAHIQYTVS